MVIRLVTHSDFLLSDFPAQLAVHESDPAAWWRSLLLEDAGHVMEELSGAGKEGGYIIHVVEEILGVLISLFRRLCEPVDGGFTVLRNLLPQQVQLAESVLRILVSLFRRLHHWRAVGTSAGQQKNF